MSVHYRHSQNGGPTLLALLATAAFCLLLGTIPEGRWIAWSTAGVLALAGVLFYQLTISVSEEAVIAAFGIGLIRRTIPLSKISGAHTVRNKWWYGFGIRLTPHGWMFNLRGLDALELELTSGRRFRLGTDRPSELRDAIRRAREMRGEALPEIVGAV